MENKRVEVTGRQVIREGPTKQGVKPPPTTPRPDVKPVAQNPPKTDR